MNLDASEYSQIPDVATCRTLINQLMAETYLQYHELEGCKVPVVTLSFTSVFNKTQGHFSEVRIINNYSESHSSHQSHVLRRSRRSIKSRFSNQSSIPLNTYQLPPHISPNFNTIQQVDVETASKLRNITFATTDKMLKNRNYS